MLTLEELLHIENNKPRALLIQFGHDFFPELDRSIIWRKNYFGYIVGRNGRYYIKPIDDLFFNYKTDYIVFVVPYLPDSESLLDPVFDDGKILIMKKFNIEDAKTILATRKKLFEAAPTATNTISLFQLMDAIILNDFKTGMLDLDASREKNLIKLEKLKNLALGTKYNEERKNAVDKCFIQFNILFAPQGQKVII